jgi:hypothetical protein
MADSEEEISETTGLHRFSSFRWPAAFLPCHIRQGSSSCGRMVPFRYGENLLGARKLALGDFFWFRSTSTAGQSDGVANLGRNGRAHGGGR